MVAIPSPADCIGVLGLALGAIGLLVSLPLLLVFDVVPWGWYLVVASGTLAAFSLLYCMIWEWDHLPPTRS
ncbi:MAG: hypothetical protein ACOCSD_06565 [Halolamina sp.]